MEEDPEFGILLALMHEGGLEGGGLAVGFEVAKGDVNGAAQEFGFLGIGDGALFAGGVGGFPVAADGLKEGTAGEGTDFRARVHEGFGQEVDQAHIGASLDDGDDIFACRAFVVLHGLGERAEEFARAGEDFFAVGFIEAVEGADKGDPTAAAVAFEKDIGELGLFAGAGLHERDFDGALGRHVFGVGELGQNVGTDGHGGSGARGFFKCYR